LSEKEKTRESLRSKLKDIRSMESQLNDLRVNLKRDEAKKKSMLDHGENFDKDKEKFLNSNKVMKIFKLNAICTCLFTETIQDHG
jgi:hypothetical protein